MKLSQITKHYHRIEFIACIRLAMKETNFNEREMFSVIYDTAKKMRVNTGFSKLKENAWGQYKKFVQYHHNFFSSKEF